MQPARPFSSLVLLALCAAAHASDAPPAARPDLPALIQCEQGVYAFQALITPVEDPLAAVALGWAPLPRSNPFMAEYRLNTPVEVFGTRTELIAISGGSVLAVIDAQQNPPHALASALDLEVVVDEAGKFMAGREVISRDLVDPQSGQTVIESAVLGVSTVSSHPGKVLVGCTYSLDLPEDEEGEDAPPLAPAIQAAAD
jgi:hypothetical protein